MNASLKRKIISNAISLTENLRKVPEIAPREGRYWPLMFSVTVSSVLTLFLKLTLHVIFVRCWEAVASNIRVEVCVNVPSVNLSVVTPVMFPARWEASFPLPVHFHVISGSDPEQRPGAVQVRRAHCSSVRGGTITAGFWLRADQTTIHCWGHLNNLFHVV